MISTLPSLRSRSAKEVEGILSSLTLDLLPNPGDPKTIRKDLDPELRHRLLDEIRVNLRLKKTDDSAESKGRIYGYLADQIQRAGLANVDIGKVKERLGQKGDLVPALYKIEFLKSVKLDEDRGVEKRQIEETLQRPDSVEHLCPGLLPENKQNKATSVYIKTYRNRIRPENTYSLLVFCTRLGYVQKVQHGWYVFHSEFDLTGARTALDVFKAFVNRYGIELEIGNNKRKLFFYESAQIDATDGTETVLIKLQRGVPTGTLNFEIGSIKDNEVMIFWTFGINYEDYDDTLRKHGIKIKRSKVAEPKQVTALMIQKVGSETRINIESGKA